MLISKKSPLTGLVNTMEIDVTHQAIEKNRVNPNSGTTIYIPELLSQSEGWIVTKKYRSYLYSSRKGNVS